MLISRRAVMGGLGALPAVGAARGEVLHRLTVVHVNDFHSRHEAVDGRTMTCAPGAAGCFGGSARWATAIRAAVAAAEGEGRAVLLLDGGDQFQGSLFYTAFEGMAELAVQHAVGTQAMVLGNHEFDGGPARLGRYVAAARFPVLSANVDVSAEPALAGLVRPWVVLDAGGLRVGVVGLTTGETAVTSSPGPNVRFTDPAAALARAVREARAAGAAVVVLLSHLGLGADLLLDAPGVALIVGGHSHTLLSNDEPGAAGPCPVHGPRGALIVQAQAYGRYVGRIDLNVGADGAVLGAAAVCHHVGAEVVPDPEVARIVAGFAGPLAAVRGRLVGRLDVALDVAGCRTGPCALGGLVAGALRGAVHGGGLPVIGLMNAGGLRVGLPAGAVTLGQVLESMPFGNTLATATLTGADVEALVRHGQSMMGRGGYPQWAGLRVGLGGIEVEAEGRWAALEPGARYVIATNNFVRGGGDGYVVLRDFGADAYDTGPELTEVVALALRASAPGLRDADPVTK